MRYSVVSINVRSTYMKKNDTTLQFRINTDLRDAFLDACKANDRTAAQLFRDFARDYVKKNRQRELKL